MKMHKIARLCHFANLRDQYDSLAAKIALFYAFVPYSFLKLKNPVLRPGFL